MRSCRAREHPEEALRPRRRKPDRRGESNKTEAERNDDYPGDYPHQSNSAVKNRLSSFRPSLLMHGCEHLGAVRPPLPCAARAGHAQARRLAGPLCPTI